jgi:hypothetical protein
VIVHSRLPPAEIAPAKSDSNRPQLPDGEAVLGAPDRTSHPGWNALVALARLLGRHAARDHMAQEK